MIKVESMTQHMIFKVENMTQLMLIFKVESMTQHVMISKAENMTLHMITFTIFAMFHHHLKKIN